MKKKIVSAILCLAMSICMAIPAFAGPASDTYKGVKMTASISSKLLSSSHALSGASGGSARLYYTKNGQTLDIGPTSSSPGPTYWNATCKIKSGTAYKATTTYSGHTITATP